MRLYPTILGGGHQQAILAVFWRFWLNLKSVKGLGLDRWVGDDAVALTDGMLEAGQLLAAHGGLDPEAELADFDLDKLACLKVGF